MGSIRSAHRTFRGDAAARNAFVQLGDRVFEFFKRKSTRSNPWVNRAHLHAAFPREDVDILRELVDLLVRKEILTQARDTAHDRPVWCVRGMEPGTSV